MLPCGVKAKFQKISFPVTSTWQMLWKVGDFETCQDACRMSKKSPARRRAGLVAFKAAFHDTEILARILARKSRVSMSVSWNAAFSERRHVDKRTALYRSRPSAANITGKLATSYGRHGKLRGDWSRGIWPLAVVNKGFFVHHRDFITMSIRSYF